MQAFHDLFQFQCSSRAHAGNEGLSDREAMAADRLTRPITKPQPHKISFNLVAERTWATKDSVIVKPWRPIASRVASSSSPPDRNSSSMMRMSFFGQWCVARTSTMLPWCSRCRMSLSASHTGLVFLIGLFSHNSERGCHKAGGGTVAA